MPTTVDTRNQSYSSQRERECVIIHIICIVIQDQTVREEEGEEGLSPARCGNFDVHLVVILLNRV